MNKGFSFIEVLITIVILSIVAVGVASSFYVPLSGTPIVEMKQIANNYAQREMERIRNTVFSSISSQTRITYPEDTKFQYEVLVTNVGGAEDLKDVRIQFYEGNSTSAIAELYTYVIDLRRMIFDDFEVNGHLSPPLGWVGSPSNTWDTQYYDSTRLQVYNYPSDGQGYSYPSTGMPSLLNFSVEALVFIKRPGASHPGISSLVEIGGRITEHTGNRSGYYVRMSLIPTTATFILIRRDISGVEFTLHTTTIPANYFNRWVTLKLGMYGNQISYWVDGALRETRINSDISGPGTLILTAQNNAGNRETYFDNIKIEW